MCYQVYTFMDAQREVSVLHNIDNHQLASATAAATLERAKFSATAQTAAITDVHADNAHRIRVRLGLGTGAQAKPAHSHRDTFHDHTAGHEGEDPYIQDDNVNTDQFIPHHSAQRDVYEDMHKKENFAATLRKNVANIKAFVSSPGKNSRSTSPSGAGGHSNHVSPERTSPNTKEDVRHAADHTTSESHHYPATTPPASSRRKVVLERDRVPVNHRADDRFNSTHDAGIGSKGPVLPDQVTNENRSSGTYVSWVKLLRNTTAGSAGGPNAQYDKVHGWHTAQEWDRQGSPPHLRPTSAMVNRLRSHRALQRPHSANSTSSARRTAASTAPIPARSAAPATHAVHPLWEVSTQGPQSSAGEGSTHVKFASGSQLVHSLSRINAPPAPVTTGGAHTLAALTPSAQRQKIDAEVQDLQASIRKRSRRPHSAGAVPFRKRSGSGKNASGITREDSIAALELELANKMLELTDHLAAHPAQQVDAATDGGTEADDVERETLLRLAQWTEDEYAYSSLPFMVRTTSKYLLLRTVVITPCGLLTRFNMAS
jgi:hypothetical protein